MLLTIKLKLFPNQEQYKDLLVTMERFNEACNHISQRAFKGKIWNKYALHKVVYYETRSKFGLSSQMVVRAISKVVESYKAGKKNLHTFDKLGGISYDARNLSFKSFDEVSILTLKRREHIPVIVGGYANLTSRKVRKQGDLIYRKGKFFLALAVETPEDTPITPEDYLGVDIGQAKLASTSEQKV